MNKLSAIQPIAVPDKILTSIPAPVKIIPLLTPIEKQLLTTLATIYVNNITNESGHCIHTDKR